ncbi:MAG: BPL-N domain-containing protein [Planctomycetota bacterium]
MEGTREAPAGLRVCAAAHVLLLLAGRLAAGEARPRAGLIAPGTKWETAYYVNDSGAEGPVVLIAGGVHGNEPAGYRAAEQIRCWPIVRGRLVVVPRANVPGLEANTRDLPGKPEERADLNRNFPGPDAKRDETRGTIAGALWRFVRDTKPDWVLDLHEGYAFRVSHKPPKGRKKSAGTSLIYRGGPVLDPIARRMQEAVNATVDDPDRRFVLLRGGPAGTSLAGASTRHLGIPAMILETTFKGQPISVRTRQHRTMVNVFLRELGIIDRDCVDVMTPRAASAQLARGGATHVALYDGEGTGASRDQVAAVVDAAPDMALHHLGPADMRAPVLRQFHVVVFPGGSGSKQARAIGPEGARGVREFVREGGGFLGVCGGAFLASAHYSWSLKLIDTSVLTGAREVEGKGEKQMWYRGGAARVKMQLTEDGKALFDSIPEHVELKYQNGPIVSPKGHPGLPPYTTLAYFRSEKVLYEPQRGTMIDTPAIVSARFHRGRVMSISPHPEAAEPLHPIITASIRWAASRARPEPAPRERRPAHALPEEEPRSADPAPAAPTPVDGGPLR